MLRLTRSSSGGREFVVLEWYGSRTAFSGDVGVLAPVAAFPIVSMRKNGKPRFAV